MSQDLYPNRLLPDGALVARFLNEADPTARAPVLQVFELCRALDELRKALETPVARPAGHTNRTARRLQETRESLDEVLGSFQFRPVLIGASTEFSVLWTGIGEPAAKPGGIAPAAVVKVILELTEMRMLDRIRRCTCASWFFARSNKKTSCSSGCRFQKFKSANPSKFNRERATYMTKYRQVQKRRKRGK